MFHQWFNRKEYGEKESELIESIKELGSKPIPYGEQPQYEEKINRLKVAFMEYLNYCENGHQEEVGQSQK